MSCLTSWLILVVHWSTSPTRATLPAVRAESLAGLRAIRVDHVQHLESRMSMVVILAEREGMARIQPAMSEIRGAMELATERRFKPGGVLRINAALGAARSKEEACRAVCSGRGCG